MCLNVPCTFSKNFSSIAIPSHIVIILTVKIFLRYYLRKKKSDPKNRHSDVHWWYVKIALVARWVSELCWDRSTRILFRTLDEKFSRASRESVPGVFHPIISVHDTNRCLVTEIYHRGFFYRLFRLLRINLIDFSRKD